MFVIITAFITVVTKVIKNFPTDSAMMNLSTPPPQFRFMEDDKEHSESTHHESC